MNKTTKILLGIVVVLAIVFAGYAFTHKQSVGSSGLPAKNGTSVTDANLYATGTITAGGIDTLSGYASTTVAATLVQGDLQNTVISIASGTSTATFTVTLPAVTTLTSFIPNVGDATTVYFLNATSTSGATLTLAAGANMTILSASSTAVIQPSKMASVEFIRNSATTIIGAMQTAN